MKKILIPGVAVAALAGLAPAIAQTTPAPAKPAAAKPAAAKPLTRVDAAQRAQQHFTQLDTNKDGFVTKAEADAAANAISERVGQRLDKRGDAMFARFDANKDGRITRAEADSVFATHKAGKNVKAAPTWDKFASRLDADKDGAISNAEFESVHAKRAERVAERRGNRGLAGQMFTTADTNKDGRVSLAEATATATAQFDKVDVNKDGTLTRDEIRVVRKGAQAQPAGR